eukprot:scaffold83323_cov27-Tisochrysis_lutea.AAC.2
MRVKAHEIVERGGRPQLEHQNVPVGFENLQKRCRCRIYIMRSQLLLAPFPTKWTPDDQGHMRAFRWGFDLTPHGKCSMRWRSAWDGDKGAKGPRALTACCESQHEESCLSTCLQWKRCRKRSWYLMMALRERMRERGQET